MTNIDWTKNTKLKQHVMEKVSESAIPFLVKFTEDIVAKRQDLMNNDYKDKDLESDVRLAVFRPIINELNTLCVKYLAYRNTWLNDEWIEKDLGDINNNPEVAKTVCISIDGVLRSDFYGFIQLIFGAFDDALRDIVKAFDRTIPESLGFVDRVKALSESIDLDEEYNAFIMLSHIRNTIHNGRIHKNPFINANELKLEYKNCTIVFKQGYPIQFNNSEDPFILIEGCITGLFTIVKDKKVVNIKDKQAKINKNKIGDLFPGKYN